MNRHLAIKMSCFCVLELRNSPAHALIPALGRLESEHFNHNLFDPDLIRGSLSRPVSEKFGLQSHQPDLFRGSLRVTILIDKLIELPLIDINHNLMFISIYHYYYIHL